MIPQQYYSVLRKPIFTEKSTEVNNAGNAAVFEVETSATKTLITKAIVAIFGVKPVSVRTMVRQGKRKRIRSRSRSRQGDIRQGKSRKFAFVRLPEGESIDFGNPSVLDQKKAS